MDIVDNAFVKAYLKKHPEAQETIDIAVEQVILTHINSDDFKRDIRRAVRDYDVEKQVRAVVNSPEAQKIIKAKALEVIKNSKIKIRDVDFG